MKDKISFWSQTWSPVVTTETPARKRSIVILPVMPRPPAEFSPFTTIKSTSCCSFSFGRQAMTASRPGWPTMSPRKSTVSIEQDRIEQVQNVDANSSFHHFLCVNFFVIVDLLRQRACVRQSWRSRQQTEMGRARELPAHDHARRIRASDQRRLLHARCRRRSDQD